MKAILAMSANPFHFGHYMLYKKAEDIFGSENVSILLANNEDKKESSFDLSYHMNPYGSIKIINLPKGSTTADFCRDNTIKYLVRGIRNGVDAEYELKMDFMNKEINPNLETIFIPTLDIYSNVSSSNIRALLSFKKHDIVKKYMNEDAMWRYINQSPSKTIYFGKSCTGKSTYLSNVNHIDADKHLWGTFQSVYDPVLKNRIQKQSKELFYSKNIEEIETICELYLNERFWNTFFAIEATHIDFASLGFYFNYIPVSLRTKFKLVKLSTSNENRNRNIIAKGFMDKINTLDEFYKEPPYFDEEITL